MDKETFLSKECKRRGKNTWLKKELVKFCKQFNLPSYGTKEVLCNRLREYFESLSSSESALVSQLNNLSLENNPALPLLPTEMKIKVLENLDSQTLIKICRNMNNSLCLFVLRKRLERFFPVKLPFDIKKFDPFIVDIFEDIDRLILSSKKGLASTPDFVTPYLFTDDFLEYRKFNTIKFLQQTKQFSQQFSFLRGPNALVEPFTDEEVERYMYYNAEKRATLMYKNSLLYKVCPLQRGDTIIFSGEHMHYTEDTKHLFIWNGTNLIHLSEFYHWDFYTQTLPSEFLILNEFPLYFFNTLDWNVKFPTEFHVDLSNVDFTKVDEYIYMFNMNGINYKLIVDSEDKHLDIKKHTSGVKEYKHVLSWHPFEEVYFESDSQPVGTGIHGLQFKDLPLAICDLGVMVTNRLADYNDFDFSDISKYSFTRTVVG